MSNRLIGVFDAAAVDWPVKHSRHSASITAQINGYDILSSCSLDALPIHRLDGLIVSRPIRSNSEIARIESYRKEGLKLVSLKTPFPRSSILLPDFEMGFKQAIEHLRSLGHENLAFIKGPKDNYTSQLRYRSFLHAAQASDFDFDTNLAFEANWDSRSVAHDFEKLLDSKGEFSAIICSGDRQAAGVAFAAHQLGIEIPKELAIVGFGNGTHPEIGDLKLSTIVYPHYSSGHKATIELIQAIENPRYEPREITLPTRLIKRWSTLGKFYLLSRTPLVLDNYESLLRFLLETDQLYSEEEICELLENLYRQNENQKACFECIHSLLNDSSARGLNPTFLHQLVTHLVDKGHDSPHHSPIEPLDEALSFARRHCLYIESFETNANNRMDSLLEPIQAMEEGSHDIFDYIETLETFRQETRAKFLSLVVFEKPLQNLSEFRTGATVWKFQEVNAPIQESLIIDQSYDPNDLINNSRQTFSLDVLPLSTEEGYVGILFLDLDTEYSSCHRKLAPIIAGKLQRLFLFNSLREKSRQLLERAEELKDQRNLADAASKAKSAFLNIMSHELRTPLNGILGMTEIALGEDISPELESYLRISLAAGHDLLALINDILDFNVLQTGEIDLRSDPINVPNILIHCVNQLRNKAESKGVAINCSVSRPIPGKLLGDENRIRQALIKLIDNATKFTNKGSINIRLKCSPENDTTSRIVFKIADTGTGIPKDKLDSIFEPFFNVDQSDTRIFNGVGLGLAIAKEITRAMKGTISVESQEGSGSEFTMSFPLRNAKLSSTHYKSSDSRDSLHVAEETSPLKILLVEDSDTNVFVAQVILTKAGHTLSIARNGKDAIERATEENFDLILMDLQLPGISGFDTAKAIRKQESLKSSGSPARIVALTAHAEPGCEDLCIEAGMDGYIAKPVTKETLLNTIEEARHAI